jgi:hypothetical protein
VSLPPRSASIARPLPTNSKSCAGDPGKGDTEGSILDACRNKYSYQLINHALPAAGHETPAVYFAFAAVIGSSGFFERTAMDRERICHGKGKSVFQRPGDAQRRFSSYRFRKTLPVLRRSKDTGGNRNWRIGRWPAYPSAGISPKPKAFRRTAQRREPSCRDRLRNEPWVRRQLTSQEGGRLARSERYARSTRSRRTRHPPRSKPNRRARHHHAHS